MMTTKPTKTAERTLVNEAWAAGIDPNRVDPRVLVPGILPNSHLMEREAFLLLVLADMRAHPLPRDPKGNLTPAAAPAIQARIREREVCSGVTVVALLSRPEGGETVAKIVRAIEKLDARRAEMRTTLRELDIIAKALGRA